jgi:hypothetical protein
MNIEKREIKMYKPNFNTPPIPSFIFDFKGIEIPKNEKHETARWINAFNEDYLGTSTKNLYPTETLFGDWNGKILILAQDALPASALKKLIYTTTQNGYPKEFAWRHANREIHGDKKGYRTNESLRILVNNYASDCGVLYGSAAAHMLYDDGCDKYRQVLKGFKNHQLQNHLIEVLYWVISNMPNLKFIMCLGERAWQVANSSAETQFSNDFRLMRQSNKNVVTTISNKQIYLIPAFHPAARASAQERERNWKTLAKLLEK